ncbi:ribosome maturation factor RimM [Jeongeupia sp. HS-3]|uniref:ribosome maturation factor RimM n=1 Tax=Jeongeupia sp. HS-3 TaxID=1009682 RepID=UPI0019100642|nr:ribosome maturation factor RimM [Jeongeupia sp. HS-3]
MGYVSGAFGIRGWLNVVADTEHADSLLDYDTWWLSRDGDWRSYTLEEGAVHTKKLAAKLVGVDGRDAAFALKSYQVAVPRSLMPAAAENEYYWSDLVGMAVVNTADEVLGKVEKLFETGANDVLVVKGAETERLLPFVAQVVLKVDVDARCITVDWGLDY